MKMMVTTVWSVIIWPDWVWWSLWRPSWTCRRGRGRKPPWSRRTQHQSWGWEFYWAEEKEEQKRKQPRSHGFQLSVCKVQVCQAWQKIEKKEKRRWRWRKRKECQPGDHGSQFSVGKRAKHWDEPTGNPHYQRHRHWSSPETLAHCRIVFCRVEINKKLGFENGCKRHVPVQKAGGGDKNSTANHGSHDERDTTEKTHSSLQLQRSLCVAEKRRGCSSTGLLGLRRRAFQAMGF